MENRRKVWGEQAGRRQDLCGLGSGAAQHLLRDNVGAPQDTFVIELA